MRKAPMNVEFFKARRRRLAQLIPNCAVVLPAWPEQYRNADTHYRYRCESNLYYLTGFDEPECCLLFRPGKTPETIMFVREKNPERETWDGFRFGLQGAKQVFGYDETYSIHDFEKLAPALLKGCEKVYYTLARNREFDSLMTRVLQEIHGGWRPKFSLGLPAVEDANSLVGELRIRKTEEEIECMRKAATISAEAHIEMMKATRPGVTERTLHGVFIKSIMERGADMEAYPGIVATGNNATTLHYRFNEDTLQDGQLILADLGAEYLYYSGDITRTWPVNGRYSATQKRIYDKILKVQKDLIAKVKPGVPHLDLQRFTTQALTEILLEEGLVKGSVDEVIRTGAHIKYYPHGVSHLLGLDTHDSGVLQIKGESRAMEAGWCLTIEPGLYFPEHDSSVPPELRGIGIRIEDDILVTVEGCEVLTKAVPKETEEIEAIIQKGV